MSTLKKNKRIKRAAVLELYGDLKPGRGNQKVERGKDKVPCLRCSYVCRDH